MVTLLSLPVAWLHFDAARAIRWSTVLLVVLLGASFAQLTWLVLPQPALPAAPLPPPAKATAGGAGSPKLDSVAALHLFGTAQATASNAASGNINAPDTSLNLVLRGLFAASRKEISFAIIAEGSGNERHFRIGDKVSGSATVRDILADRVVLERNGSYEILRLPKERLDMAAPPAKAGAGKLTANNAARSTQLRELRDTIKNNPQELMSMAEMQPVVEDGQLRGYHIRPRRHLELFQASGLTVNDVVTAVNGIPVTDPGQFASLTSQLTNATTLRLSIERPNGMTDEVVIDLN